MSAVQKLLLVAGALVVLVGGFVVASSSGGDDEPAPQPAAQTEIEAAPVEGTSDGHAAGEQAAREEADDAPGEQNTQDRAAPSPPPETARISVADGAVEGGAQTVRVQRGDRVRLTVTSDVPEEVHLHGYDIERPVGPGRPARLRFTADAEGVFELELHGSGLQVAELEVAPR